MSRTHRLTRALGMLLGASMLVTACTSPWASEPPSRGDRLAAAIEHERATNPNLAPMTSIVVVDHGETLVERYYRGTADDPVDVGTITVSVLSMLVGIALGEGRISGVDATLGGLLPSYDLRPRVAHATLRDVLTMTAGFVGYDDNALLGFTRSPDWVREVLAGPLAPPSRGFDYSYGGAHVLSAVLEQATGMPASEYARSRLFGPLGIESTNAWPADGQGHTLGWSGLRLRPTDLARLGRLYLDGGIWDGHRVVPALWVQESTRRHVGTPRQGGTNPVAGYGYLWWTGRMDGDPAFWAWGYGGQLVEVVPRRDLVVVITSAQDDHPVGYVTAANLIQDVIATHLGP